MPVGNTTVRVRGRRRRPAQRRATVPVVSTPRAATAGTGAEADGEPRLQAVMAHSPPDTIGVATSMAAVRLSEGTPESIDPGMRQLTATAASAGTSQRHFGATDERLCGRMGTGVRGHAEVPQHGSGRAKSAHPVDAAARRRCRRAEIHIWDGRAVGVPPHGGAKDRLAQCRGAGVDVAADEIGVVVLPLVPRTWPSGPGPGLGSRERTARSAASMRSVMSTSDPLGTWQYAHRVCQPSGARLGSATQGWATRQNGCSGYRPATTSASARATSSKVPPTCSVTARRQTSALQGTGPLSAQSTLHTPGPWR